jgi:hypothetical protein
MEEQKIKEILDTFSPHDIYSVDKTRVLWETSPDCTLAFKNGCV